MKLFSGARDNKPGDIVAWAEKHVRLVGSVRSETYDRNITPWTIEPIQRIADSATKIITLVKPVQTGGSRVGLIGLAYWAKFGTGQIQYNWEKDEKAEFKWHNETLPTLEQCSGLEWGDDRFDTRKCYSKFRRAFIQSQGVFNPDNLDSDSIPYQVNEEIHSWKPGHLAKARARQTAVWFPRALDISNAGMVGDQLYQAFENGTKQFWEVKCPGCGEYHQMRTRWEDSKPELGGLRYDTEGCKLENERFDYNRLERTLYYQMPCGHRVNNNFHERRALSLTGRYSAPTNPGAHISHRSYTYDAVCVDFIPWLTLVQEKHTALRALKGGDAMPWQKYIQERECRFYSEETRPYQGAIVLNTAIRKNRAGLQDRACRLWSADKQRGYKAQGQLSHYWLVIEDVLSNCSSQIVFEGQVQTDTELIAVLDEHKAPRSSGVVDASWDTKAVLEMCYRNGLNAVMGNKSMQGSFLHKSDGVRRFYSEDKCIHAELSMPPKFNYSPTRDGWIPNREEPIVIFYNKGGLLQNHFFIRDHKKNVLGNNPNAERWEYIEREVPGDVSEDFKLHNEAWERVPVVKKATNDEVEGFRKVRPADHMLMCCAYIDLLKDWCGLLGEQLSRLGVKPNVEK